MYRRKKGLAEEGNSRGTGLQRKKGGLITQRGIRAIGEGTRVQIRRGKGRRETRMQGRESSKRWRIYRELNLHEGEGYLVRKTPKACGMKSFSGERHGVRREKGGVLVKKKELCISGRS